LKSGTSSPKLCDRPNGVTNNKDSLMVLEVEHSNLRVIEAMSELQDPPEEKSILDDAEVDPDPAGSVLNADYSLSSS
jgi:hypothetical protein